MKLRFLYVLTILVFLFAVAACNKKSNYIEATVTNSPAPTNILTPDLRPSRTPTHTATSRPANTPVINPDNTPSPTPVADKSEYSFVSDKLYFMIQPLGSDENYRGPKGYLYIRDVIHNGVTTKELSMWNGDDIIWTSNETLKKNSFPIEDIDGFWIVETEKGTELLISSMNVNQKKVTHYFEVIQIEIYAFEESN